jgi:heptaprenyl diphosphate synthase
MALDAQNVQDDLNHVNIVDLPSPPERADVPPGRLPLGDFQAELNELEQRLARGSEPAVVRLMASELFQAGGKRLRALAALDVGRALAVPAELAILVAELVELTHGATLLHDDVIDEADTRRGQPAARVRWSNTLSVLGGDFLLLRALDRVAELGCAELGRWHRTTLRELLGAEVAQHQARRAKDWSVDGYLAIARGKTGALFALACAGPALCAEDRASSAGLSRFGNELGVAFQIADDLRDLLGLDPGKPSALDLTDGVPSLPIRLAAAADGELRARLEASASAGPAAEAVPALRRAVVASGGAAAAVRIAREHLARSRAALASLGIHDRLGLLRHAGPWLEDELQRCEVAS